MKLCGHNAFRAETGHFLCEECELKSHLAIYCLSSKLSLVWKIVHDKILKNIIRGEMDQITEYMVYHSSVKEDVSLKQRNRGKPSKKCIANKPPSN